MGLSIYYKGNFNKNSSLEELIEEVKDIAEIQNWKYHIFDQEFPAQNTDEENWSDLYGICFTPPGCETVDIVFNNQGKMTNLFMFFYFNNNPGTGKPENIYDIAVKTQYAGIEIHKLIIHLFKYLEKKYFTAFEMTDEGCYWETGDEIKLKERFDRYNFIVDSVAGSFNDFPKLDNENMEDYLSRILKEIAKNKNL